MNHQRLHGALPPPPRRVRASWRRGWLGIWFVRIFTFPHALVALALPVVFAAVLWIQLTAEEVSGVVDGSGTTELKGRTSHWIRITYRVGESVFSTEESVNASVASKYPGSKVAVQAIPIRVWHASIGSYRMVRLNAEPHWAGLVMVALFPIVWVALLSGLIIQWWVLPWRFRRLCESGVAVPGTVVHWRRGYRPVWNGLMGTLASYRFRTLEGQEVCAEMPFFRRLGIIAPTGAATVLYDPRDPRRSVVYELGLYEVAKAVADDKGAGAS